MGTLKKQVRELELKLIIDALISNGFNQVKAAKELDISRGTLRTIVAEYTGSSSNLTKSLLSKGILSSVDSRKEERRQIAAESYSKSSDRRELGDRRATV